MAKIELSKKIEEETLEIGDFFFNKESKEVFILSGFCDSYVLVCLNDGYFWHDPQTNKEEIFSNSRENFIKVTVPFTVTIDRY